MKKKLFYGVFLLMSLFSCERMIDNYWKEQEDNFFLNKIIFT